MLQLLKVIYPCSHGVVFVKRYTCVQCTGAIVQQCLCVIEMMWFVLILFDHGMEKSV